jgi:signal peptidase II
LNKTIVASILIVAGIFIIDQNIKEIFVSGFRYDGECISGVLTYNRGVAFSLFAFLEEYLKWIQIAILSGIVAFILSYKDSRLYLPIAFIVGAGASNIADRFIHGGVVDYVYWHCWFDFAIFNFADVVIDFGVVWILFLIYKDSKKERENV